MMHHHPGDVLRNRSGNGIAKAGAMNHNLVLELSSLLVLGVAGQWIAWRLRIPSIVVLLVIGFLAGPVLGLLRPDELLGDGLFAIVSISVAIILFEGGLGLNARQIRLVRPVLLKLLSIGVLVNGGLCALAARWILGWNWPLSVLFGSILIVTGPTVITPLVRQLRLQGQVGSLLKWEGIMSDPLGAVLAVLVFHAIRIETMTVDVGEVARGLLTTTAVGAAFGAVAAGLLILSLKRYWIPDSLQHAAVLMAVITVFAGANQLQKESGLIAVTIMGVIMANQRLVPVRRLLEFKETVGTLLVGILFVLLTSRLSFSDLSIIRGRGWLFLAAIVIVARPAAVLLSTLGSRLKLQRRLFIAGMAPRGIVAAAVLSIFSISLARLNYPQAEQFAPVGFFVVVCTVMGYGLSAPWLAKRLGLVQDDPQGVLFVGMQGWALDLALSLKKEGIPVLGVDTNRDNAMKARLSGLPVFVGSVLSESVKEEMNLTRIRRLIALTPNDELNALGCQHFRDLFGRNEIYQLPHVTGGRFESVSIEHRGRMLFPAGTDPAAWIGADGRDRLSVRKTNLTEQFSFETFRLQNRATHLPVFLIPQKGGLAVFTRDTELKPQPGDAVISLTLSRPGSAA
ncbi:sodium:proton antiporter [bacterium]|nr:sodium:proton antiporter [bacterium]